MIVRTWVAYAKPGNARAYREHLRGSILPQQVEELLQLRRHLAMVLVRLILFCSCTRP